MRNLRLERRSGFLRSPCVFVVAMSLKLGLLMDGSGPGATHRVGRWRSW
jgi:hypothetical protein